MAAVQAAEPALGLCQSAAVSGGKCTQMAAAQAARRRREVRRRPFEPTREAWNRWVRAHREVMAIRR